MSRKNSLFGRRSPTVTETVNKTMVDVEIREGLLCPICMKDLGTVLLLQEHFDEAHASEDKAVLNQLKGLFGKAKKRIMKVIDDELDSDDAAVTMATSSSASGGVNVEGWDPTLWEPQEFGACRNHTNAFKGIRDARVDRHVIETNKLLIRLDKLISDDVPKESGKRKAYEKAIVPWVRDTDAKKCGRCERLFTLTRRRHHCRLCGDILCDRCSQFLPYTFAKKLTDPAFQSDGELGFLHRSDSNGSLNSIMGPEGEAHLRTCGDCRQLLERRDQVMEMRNTKPTTVLLYEKMKQCITQSEEILQKYLPMVESLCQGEASYDIFEAQRLRVQLTKLFEAIDILSKKILTSDMDNENPPSQKQMKLQKTIRLFASNFMQDNLVGLHSLPSETEYEKLKQNRKIKIQQTIAAERLTLMDAQERDQSKKSHTRNNSQPFVKYDPNQSPKHKRSNSSGADDIVTEKVGSGWKPVISKSTTSSLTDPMIQQMDIIRSYIKQAKEANRYDEVEMLTQNLRDLQTEYHDQRERLT